MRTISASAMATMLGSVLACCKSWLRDWGSKFILMGSCVGIPKMEDKEMIAANINVGARERLGN